MHISAAKLHAFRTRILSFHKTHGRHTLPWRKTRDPYHILVSEVMLQQTQVDRVIPYFTIWLQVFPDVHTLARAPLAKVLRVWQGLGYNRRAKMLHEAAKVLSREYYGVFPKEVEALERLPGIGPYTARAVAAFAYNKDGVFIETNIRTVVTHHFFSERTQILDREILAILEKAFPKGKARVWYSALMDYGAYLKKNGVRINGQAKGYTKQKAFSGSDREARGAIIKALTQGPKSRGSLSNLFGKKRITQMERQLVALTKEGLITATKDRFSLPR